jgi:hypothetical protein
MTFLSFSLGFDLLAVILVSWIRNSNFILLCCRCTHQGGDWETKWSVPWFDLWWVIDFTWFEFESRKFQCFYPIMSCGETCLIVSWCVGDRCGVADSNEDRGGSRWLGAEDQGWSSTDWVLSHRTIKRSGDAMCGLHHAQRDEEHRFLGLALKPRSIVSPSLASKPVAMCFLVWASKPAAAVWWFGPQNHHDGFLVWASKQSGIQFVGCATKPTGW